MDTTFYCFGPFRLYPSEQLLLRGQEPIALAPKTFEVLLALVAGNGSLMSRDSLMQAIWPRGYVEEINLTVNVSLLRKALGTLADGSAYILTVPKRGYRFNAPVTRESGDFSATAALPHTDAAAAVDTAALAEAGHAVPIEAPPGLPLPPTPPRAKPRTTPGLLRRAALLMLALGALASGAIWLVHPRGGRDAAAPTASIAIRSLAVLPFELISDRTDEAYLGLGLTDALITRLSGQGAVRIRPIAAVRRYAGSRDPTAAGTELHVDAVLDGTIQRVAGQTRVSVRLLRVDSGAMLWTDTFDSPPETVFALEDSISQRLSAALALELSADEQQRLSYHTTHSSDAYDLYTQARVRLGSRNIASMRTSLDLFQQAIRADPGYAAAYAGLADAYILTGTWSSAFPDPHTDMREAKRVAEKALLLNRASPEAHTSLAYLRLSHDWDWDGAEREFKRALDLNPAYLNAHLWYAHELVALGRMDDAYAEDQAALDLDPGDLIANDEMAWYDLYARHYAAAIAQATRTIAIDPDYPRAHHVLGLAYLYAGAYDKACREFSGNVTRSHGSPVALAHLARCHAAAHRSAAARAILAMLEREAGQRYTSPVEIAAVHAALGDRAAALHWLDTACNDRAGELIYLNVDPAFDPLRDQPQFRTIVARVNPAALATLPPGTAPRP